ncbi:sigma 54-interacting transcriptional regulator [Virgibacillus necropolis]|uniref:HTH-type transcriptional regulatory protein TyrR n=1 Tax=Virgibacillus necropolis TaxID=163877 RepID=A0A221MEX2_9BACI|nr:sigma 54-interacting transcriptional regulator [Virgibacillus necropolis]ASN06223.1 Fis family transcriptional regulator [Virgibacillus necropolis]
MNPLIQNKLKPIFTVSRELEQEEFLKRITDHHGHYLFLEKHNEIYAYVDINNLAIKKWDSKEIRMKDILSKAVLIENTGVFESNQLVSIPFIFQVLGEPIVLVKDDNGNFTGYISREDMLVSMFREENTNTNLLKVLLASIPMGIFVVDHKHKIVNCNESGLKMIRSESEKIIGTRAETIFNQDHLKQVFSTGKTILNQIHITNDMGVIVDYSPIENSDGDVDGVIIIIQDLPMVESMAMEIETVKNLNQDLNAILSSIYDELLVVDSEGVLIRHSENYIKDFWKVNLKELVGESLLDLEERGFFSPSVARLVLEKKEKISIVQETENGKKILAIGNPIFNDRGILQRVVIASRDITENTKLKSELKQTKEITKRYKQELANLKNKTGTSQDIIYCSSKMQKIVNQIKKISSFSSTVLIQGDSGVGKELIARAIHTESTRSEKPFLTINCGSIPENLLESELFGYVKGSFTGADEKGKKGYFEQANGGVLFLDEIGEMPMSLQVKLLRVLQENEVVPIGSVKPISINVQIVAATNQSLEKMIDRGVFREDLYYRINVIPIHVPPLRDRPEDIPLLAYHTIQKLNQRYDKNYHFSPDSLNLLEGYSWPGNIRELQNLIERLFVSADDQVITADLVVQFMNSGTVKRSKPMITGIIPLHEAKWEVEKQLIMLAMRKHRTTTKAAEVLGISQSAVSRKYKRILQQNGE